MRVIRAVVSMALFGVLTVQVRQGGWLTRADDPVREWFVAHRSSVWTMVALAGQLGSPRCVMALTCVIAGLALWRRSLSAAVTLVGVVSLTEIAVTLAKLAIGRARPPLATQVVRTVGFSYPSGHAAATTAFVGALVLVFTPASLRLSRKLFRYAAAAFAVTGVGTSRIYLGVHWLSDVAGGVRLGSAVVLVAAAAAELTVARLTSVPPHQFRSGLGLPSRSR
jgi:membrane-associated phospholipid phosphatase